MSKMKLETLTSLHIGSGDMLQKDSDFVFGKDADGYPVVYVINPRKVLSLIGEENVVAWTVGIENGRSTEEIVKLYAPKATITDYSLHAIDSYLSRPAQQIKEFIRDGLDRPYIPGSSIKGAIRTAVFTDIASTMNADDFRQTIMNEDDITSKAIEADAFGKDPNHDVFRYLRVGDAYATGYRTSVYEMKNIADHPKKAFWDSNLQMATEVLLPDTEVDFSLVLKRPDLLPDDMPATPRALSSVEALLDVINNHTRMLLNDEIDIWEKMKDNNKKIKKWEEKVDKYIDLLSDLLHTANRCKGTRSAVMRMGHGSGWRFVTGAGRWRSRLTEDDLKMVINAMVEEEQQNNKRSNKTDDFPKSRWLEEEECEPLGFVKLTLCD